MSLISNRERILWRLFLRSDVTRVYQAISTDVGREAFWCKRSQQTGERIDLEFVNGMRTTAKVLSATPPTEIVFDYFDTRARFTLTRDGANTRLELENTSFPTEMYDELLAGWLNVLFPLKAYVDYGVDLRANDPTALWEDGYADQ